MEPVPTPCPAHLVPDVAGAGGFNAAYHQAKAQHAVFVAIESQRPWWTVKADTLTAGPEHTVDDAVNAAREAVMRLVAAGEVRSDAYTAPFFSVLHGADGEHRGRELAASLYGDLEPLTHAAPTGL
ncbi:hypothetical protein JK360_29625 [Streptomyces sp. 9-7]|uniref:Uncharacterized protein n=1 Tax=Streptomyces siderophoricus TaxID=2802281 RepID=A0ABS1N053_9ACTN|nr:hypothetical protein [Streptomyces sp. 9-7]